MPSDFLGDRRTGLENAFFAKQDAMLRQKLAEMNEDKAKKAALARASGISDEALLDKLLALNVTAETLTALSVVPLAAVAWADGSIDARERTALLSAAEKLGLDKQHAGYQMLSGWLENRPTAELVAAWKAYVSGLTATMTDDAKRALKSELLDQAKSVAEAAGGFLGLAPKVSAAEKAVLDDLERAF